MRFATFKAGLIRAAYRCLVASWRKTLIEDEGAVAARAQGRPLVLAHWHGDALTLAYLARTLHIATMISNSRDGEFTDHVIRGLGGLTVRGSSTRGGVAGLKGLVRLCRQGRNAALAVDGPRGPYHQVKPGVFQVARLAHGVIVPLGAAVSRAHVLRKSWDQTRLPYPGARVVVYMGAPVHVPTGDGAGASLAAAIDAAGQRAATLLAGAPGVDRPRRWW